MAISTGDICPEAIAQIQADLTAINRATMNLHNLCFIFKFPYEPDNVSARTKFQEIIDWFDAESWTDGYVVYANWRRQSITIGDPDAVAGP